MLFTLIYFNNNIVIYTVDLKLKTDKSSSSNMKATPFS